MTGLKKKTQFLKNRNPRKIPPDQMSDSRTPENPRFLRKMTQVKKGTQEIAPETRIHPSKKQEKPKESKKNPSEKKKNWNPRNFKKNPRKKEEDPSMFERHRFSCPSCNVQSKRVVLTKENPRRILVVFWGGGVGVCVLGEYFSSE